MRFLGSQSGVVNVSRLKCLPPHISKLIPIPLQSTLRQPQAAFSISRFRAAAALQSFLLIPISSGSGAQEVSVDCLIYLSSSCKWRDLATLNIAQTLEITRRRTVQTAFVEAASSRTLHAL